MPEFTGPSLWKIANQELTFSVYEKEAIYVPLDQGTFLGNGVEVSYQPTKEPKSSVTVQAQMIDKVFNKLPPQTQSTNQIDKSTSQVIPVEDGILFV